MIRWKAIATWKNETQLIDQSEFVAVLSEDAKANEVAEGGQKTYTMPPDCLGILELSTKLNTYRG